MRVLRYPEFPPKEYDGSRSQQRAGSGDGLKLWRAEVSECSVKLVNCPKGRWPESDEEGQIVFDNTHFDTPDQAWDKVEREYAAGIELTLNAINHAQKHLDELKDQLVTDSLSNLKAKENRQAWNRQNDQAQRPPPETPGRLQQSRANYLNRPTARRGGGSLQRSGYSSSASSMWSARSAERP